MQRLEYWIDILCLDPDTQRDIRIKFAMAINIGRRP